MCRSSKVLFTSRIRAVRDRDEEYRCQTETGLEEYPRKRGAVRR